MSRTRWSPRNCCELLVLFGRVPYTFLPILHFQDSFIMLHFSFRTLKDGPRFELVSPGSSSAFLIFSLLSSGSGSSGGSKWHWLSGGAASSPPSACSA